MAEGTRREFLQYSAGTLVGSLLATQRASASTVGDTVYMHSTTGTVYAIDSQSGEPQWSFESNEEFDGGAAVTPPTVVGGRVYFGTGSSPLLGQFSAVFAVDAASGAEIWRYEEVDGEITAGPTVLDGDVYLAELIGSVRSLDTETGDENWVSDVDGRVSGAPTVVDGRVVVGTSDELIIAFDTEDGETVWEREVDGPVSTAVAVFHGAVYATTDSGTVYALEASSGDILWTKELDATNITSPTVVESTIYLGAGQSVYALQAISGNKRWSVEMSDEVNAPTTSEGVVYAGSDEGKIAAIEAQDGTIKWIGPTNMDVDDGFTTGPSTVAGGSVYVPHGAALLALDKETGAARWTQPSGDVYALRVPPTVVADSVSGDSTDSRVTNGTFGHHHVWANRASDSGDLGTYLDNGGGDISNEGLFEAAKDWRDGEINNDLLFEIAAAWR